uniref:Uncharacterized protein n=1 Tax=Anguilla anguilla TaxID=7936 RepID=A0A0E9WTM8_ANGAN
MASAELLHTCYMYSSSQTQSMPNNTVEVNSVLVIHVQAPVLNPRSTAFHTFTSRGHHSVHTSGSPFHIA